jgi:hypothetical protein
LRCGVAVQIELDLINVAPTPAFRRVVTFDDRMSGGVKMLRGVLSGGLIAAANVTAMSTDPQMDPRASGFKALLAASGTGLDLHDAAGVGTLSAHGLTFQVAHASTSTRGEIGAIARRYRE